MKSGGADILQQKKKNGRNKTKQQKKETFNFYISKQKKNEK